MFNIVESTIGAILIQLATTSYLAECGKTIGFSSVIYNSVFSQSRNTISICIGLLISSLVCYNVIPEYVPLPLSMNYSFNRIILAATLVGWGSSWGSGCTSGHMLCGISLMRKRSIVATLVFCSTAMVVANFYSAQNLSQCVEPCYTISFDTLSSTKLRLLFLLSFAVIINRIKSTSAQFSGFKAGFVFGLGLFISGMANPEKPLRFLSVFHPSKFDPSLFMIVLFAIIPNIATWKNITRRSHPSVESSFNLPTITDTPPKFIVGNILFGLGWGILGVCPGPGFITSIFSVSGITWLGTFLLSSLIARNM